MLLYAAALATPALAAAEPIEDTQAPQILSLAIEPEEVDTSLSSQTVAFTAHITDDLSGVQSAGVTIISPGGGQVAGAGLSLLSGSATDGVYHGTATIPQFAETGTWKIADLNLRDNAGNYSLLETPQLEALGLPVAIRVSANAQPPVVTALVPGSGAEYGGTAVEIAGSGFEGATEVLFGQTPAAEFTVNSPTSITATAPAGTGAVDVVVKTTAGTSEPIPADLFRYSPPVALITSRNPSPYGKNLTFTARVAPEAASAPIPEGTVRFIDGSTILGVATLNGNGVAKLRTKSLQKGDHEVRAEYSGDGYFGPSDSTVLVQAIN